MLLEQAGRTPSATARVTGLSRVTVQRVRDGVSSPTLKTLRELALAEGYDLDVRLVPPSDPAAAIAARVMLDPEMTQHVEFGALEGNTQSPSADVAAWVERIERQQKATLDEILAFAGRYSAPQFRKGAQHFAPRPGLSRERIAKATGYAGASSSGPYAISGVPAAELYLDHEVTLGPTVVWAEQPDAIVAALEASFRRVDSYQPGGIVVAPTLTEYFVDSVTDPVTRFVFVSPIQAAIDLHGLGYIGLAESITEGW